MPWGVESEKTDKLFKFECRLMYRLEKMPLLTI